MADSQSTRTSQTSAISEPQSMFFSQRSKRQLSLFAAGAGFVALSSLITRRSIVRKYKATVPKFYQFSTRPNAEINGAMEAFEALNIATINVASVGMMAAGGMLWALDISSVEDMRSKVRTNMGIDPIRKDDDADAELEEWFATVLARKEFKALRSEYKSEKGVKEKEQDGEISGTVAKDQEKKQ